MSNVCLIWTLGQCFSNFNVHMNHPGILLNMDSDSIGLGVQIHHMSNKLPVIPHTDDMGEHTIFTQKDSTGPGRKPCALVF